MTYQLSSPTPVQSSSLLELNWNMNLNPETIVHDDMCNVKYGQIDTLYEPILFEPLKQIKVSHATLKVTSFIDCGPCLNSFSSLDRYIWWLEENWLI